MMFLTGKMLIKLKLATWINKNIIHKKIFNNKRIRNMILIKIIKIKAQCKFKEIKKKIKDMKVKNFLSNLKSNILLSKIICVYLQLINVKD